MWSSQNVDEINANELLRTLNTGGCAVLLHQIHCFVCQLEQMRMRAIAICHNRKTEFAITIA
jgi:hypothetical protein